MRWKFLSPVRLVLVIIVAGTVSLYAQSDSLVQLPVPELHRGKPLMEALALRASSRSYSSKEIPLQELSNMLWAGFGINRPEDGGRTAPSTMNMQEIDLYVVQKAGLFRYNPESNTLRKIHGEDIGALTGDQGFVKDAPVNIVLVADYRRTGKIKPEQWVFYTAADAAFVSQNIYLYCASEGFATVVRAYINKKRLAKAMRLTDNQAIIFAQSIGYPKK